MCVHKFHLCLRILYVPQAKKPSLTCTRAMTKTLQNGDWLTDDHIRLAQNLLRNQFPGIDDLQSPLLSQNDGFVPVQAEG